MAYYVRSDAPSGRYIRTDVPDGRYLAHSAKGTEWSKGHKYVDKRWIQGAWHYLYPEMLEAAKKAGDAVKDTAKKATDTVKKASDTVKETAKNVKASAEKKVEETKKTAKDFKDYSKKTDIKEKGLNQDLREREKYGQAAGKEYAKNQKDLKSTIEELDGNARKQNNKAYDNMQTAKEVYGEKSEQYKAAKEDFDAAHERWKELKDEENRIRDRQEQIEVETTKNEDKYFDTEAELDKVKAEKETAKYKASKALNDVIDGTTGATKQAAQWLKNQLNSGADWTTDQIEKIRESDAVASLAGKLENLYANSNSGAMKKGLSILSQIIGWGKLEAPKKSSGSSSSGHTYSGTGTKAQRREAVDGGPVSNNDYSNRPKKRR